MQATTNKEGVCELGRGAQLYVGRTYTIEVSRASAIEPFSTTFEVHPGEQTVKLQLQRACGPVRAIVTMQLADDPAHWASSLPLPWPTSYRVVHKALGLTVFEAEVPKTAVHTYHTPLPSDGVLFVDETCVSRLAPLAASVAHRCLCLLTCFLPSSSACRYVVEVGFQAKEQVIDAQHALDDQLSGRGLLFNGAGDLKLPAIERAWSVDYLFDDDSALLPPASNASTPPPLTRASPSPFACVWTWLSADRCSPLPQSTARTRRCLMWWLP